MLSRWIRFAKQRFGADLLPVALSFAAVDLCGQLFLSTSPSHLAVSTGLAAVTGLLFSLAIRCSDELRDLEVDRKYFQDRPLVVGTITTREVTALGVTAVLAGLAINVALGGAVKELVAAAVFLYLVTRWYFLPSLISTNRFIAVLANLPFWFFLYLAPVTMASGKDGTDASLLHRAALTLWMLLPLHAYEFSRKTVLPSEEKPGYQTYSSLIGFKRAALIGPVFLLVHYALLFAVAQASPLARPPSLMLVVGLGTLLLLNVGAGLRMARGRSKGSFELERTSGFYYLGSMVLLIVEALKSA